MQIESAQAFPQRASAGEYVAGSSSPPHFTLPGISDSRPGSRRVWELFFQGQAEAESGGARTAEVPLFDGLADAPLSSSHPASPPESPLKLKDVNSVSSATSKMTSPAQSVSDGQSASSTHDGDSIERLARRRGDSVIQESLDWSDYDRPASLQGRCVKAEAVVGGGFTGAFLGCVVTGILVACSIPFSWTLLAGCAAVGAVLGAGYCLHKAHRALKENSASNDPGNNPPPVRNDRTDVQDAQGGSSSAPLAIEYSTGVTPLSPHESAKPFVKHEVCDTFEIHSEAESWHYQLSQEDQQAIDCEVSLLRGTATSNEYAPDNKLDEQDWDALSRFLANAVGEFRSTYENGIDGGDPPQPDIPLMAREAFAGVVGVRDALVTGRIDNDAAPSHAAQLINLLRSDESSVDELCSVLAAFCNATLVATVAQSDDVYVNSEATLKGPKIHLAEHFRKNRTDSGRAEALLKPGSAAHALYLALVGFTSHNQEPSPTTIGAIGTMATVLKLAIQNLGGRTEDHTAWTTTDKFASLERMERLDTEPNATGQVTQQVVRGLAKYRHWRETNKETIAGAEHTALQYAMRLAAAKTVGKHIQDRIRTSSADDLALEDSSATPIPTETGSDGLNE